MAVSAKRGRPRKKENINPKLNEKKVIVDVRGLKIKKDSIYEIGGKYDSNAPSGLRKLGSSVFPGTQRGVSVRGKKIEGTDTVLFDTGFYVQSPCYYGMDSSVVKTIVESLQKNIVEPYEELVGVKGILDHTNTDFWETKIINLREKRVFSTNNPVDLLELYLAVNGGHLQPKNATNSSYFNNAVFTVSDKEESVDYSKQRNIEKFKAIGRVTSFLADENTSNLLIEILYYLEAIQSWVNLYDDNDIINAFQTWLELDETNASKFMELTEDIGDGKQEQLIKVTNAFKYFTGKSIQKQGVDYWYEGKLQLGRTPSESIRRLCTGETSHDKELGKQLAAVREELLERYENRQ